MYSQIASEYILLFAYMLDSSAVLILLLMNYLDEIKVYLWRKYVCNACVYALCVRTLPLSSG